MSLTTLVRRVGGAVRRELFPAPKDAAWRRINARATRGERYTPGRLQLLDVDLEYVDALTTAVQWNELFVRRTLELRTSNPAPRVLDCGANVGLASIWLKQHYPAARITAFEPDATIAAVLGRNLQRNRAGDVEVIRAAVWREDGELPFRREGADSGALAAVAADTAGPIVPVTAVRLKRWLEQGPIDLLKLDIEGAELDVLEDVVDRLDGVRAIQVEVHDFDPGRRLLPQCLLLLERAGFTYALDDFAVASWRPAAHVQGPFSRAVPSWIVLVRAWKPVSHS